MKKNKNIVLTISFILALGCIIAFVVYVQPVKRHVTMSHKNPQGHTSDTNTSLVSLERMYAAMTSKDSNKMLNSDLVFGSDKNGNITFSKFLKKYITSPKLIFRYADINCNVCVDSSLSLLNEISKNIGSGNVFILASYRNTRDLFIWKRINNIKYPVFQIPYDQTGLHIESGNIPYFFVLLPHDARVNHLFAPMKENTNRTRRYLYQIGDRYFLKNK